MTRVEVLTSTPMRMSVRSAYIERSSGKVGRTRGPASSKMMQELRGSIRRKSLASLARDLGDGPGHFDAGRSPTDDDESEQTLPLGIVAGELGLLERQQNTSANAGRVFDALEPRCEINPMVVTEIGVRGACRDHEIVVGNWTRVGLNAPPCQVDAADLRHQHRRIALVP